MKKRAFVRYSKNGKIVPGSLILTSGSFPSGPSTWKEVPADLCCVTSYGLWKLVTGGEAGDGVVLLDDTNVENQEFTFVGPNDDENNGWVYLKKYFPTETCLAINYQWTSFDDGTSVDRPVYWTSITEPTGEPDDTTAQVGSTPDDGTWNITVPAGQWFSLGIYSTDSCCGRGFLQVNINEVACTTTTTTVGP